MIYAVLKCALYGDLTIYLLFWRDLVSKLKYLGFQTNPYDPCDMNKVIGGNYCTVCWRIDYLKISHVHSTVTDDVILGTEDQYGKVAPITTSLGKVHNYLGMLLDFSSKDKAGITIPKHTQRTLGISLTDMHGLTLTPDANNLFQVQEDGSDL